MDVFDLSAKISLDTQNYDKELSSAEKSGKGFASKLGRGLKTAGKVGGAAIGVVGAAAGVMSKKFIDGVKVTSEYGDKVDKMSQKIGISAKSYQQWDYVMQRAGMSIDTMKMGMKTLSTQAEKNSDSFQKLGISQEEVKNLSQEDLFEKTIEGLSKMEAGTERTKLATELLGRAGADMGPLLNEGTKEIKKQMKMTEDYGMVMSDKAVKASAAFQDSLTTMKSTMTGVKNKMGAEFLPAITKVTDGLAKVFSGDMSGMNKVSKGIDKIVGKIAKAMPKILELGGKILGSLGDAILKNTPKLIPVATKMLVNFVEYVIKAIPKLFEIGTQIITELIKAISNALPELIQSAGDIIDSLADGISNNLPILTDSALDIMLKLINGLIKNLPKLVNAGLKIIQGLAKGLLKAIPKLVKAVPKIINGLVDALLNSIPQIIDAGIDLLTSLVDDLPQIIDTIVKAIPEIITGIINALLGNIDKIVDAGVKLLTALIEDLPKIITTIVEKLPKLIAGIVKALIGSIPKLVMAGLKLAGGIIKGILDFVVKIPGKLVEFIGGIIDYFASGQVIEDLKAAGKAIIDAVWEGMKALWETVKGWVTGIVDWIKDKWKKVKKFLTNIFASKTTEFIENVVKKQGVVAIETESGTTYQKGTQVWDPDAKKWVSIKSGTGETHYRYASQRRSLDGVSTDLAKEQTESNERVIEAINSLGDIIKKQAAGDSQIVLDNREIGRMVRKYA